MRRRASLLLVLTVIFAGCTSPETQDATSSSTASPSTSPAEAGSVNLTGSVDPEPIRPGQDAVVQYRIENRGPSTEYWKTSFCGQSSLDGSDILTIDVRDAQGGLVPHYDAQQTSCTGPPDERKTLARGDILTTNWTWDAMRYDDADGNPSSTPRPSAEGTYTIGATFSFFPPTDGATRLNLTLTLRP